MDSMPLRALKPIHFSRHGNTGFEFDPKATEVAILDRSGRTIWQKRKGENLTPIRWTGIDTTGPDRRNRRLYLQNCVPQREGSLPAVRLR